MFLKIEANIIGALSAFAYCRKNITTLYEEGILNIAIVRLNLTVPNILINSTRMLALCAKENVPRRYSCLGSAYLVASFERDGACARIILYTCNNTVYKYVYIELTFPLHQTLVN